MTHSGIVRKQLHLFDAVAQLYAAGLMVLTQQASVDSTLAMSQFLSGYAFERQGRSPAYASVARDIVQSIGASADVWADPEFSFRVWDSFLGELSQLPSNTKANPKNNPLCPSGYACETRRGERRTRQPPVIEFAQQRLTRCDYNILAWARDGLSDGVVGDVHKELCDVNGIGAKIASFFLRDVAWRFEIQVPRHRALLQPIDVWVKRTVQQLDHAGVGREGEWIVEMAERSGVSPEALNAGMWYSGAQVVRNEFDHQRALSSPEAACELMIGYVETLRKQAKAWKQGERTVDE